MDASGPSEHHESAPYAAPGSDIIGVLVLGLLAIAAFCCWYLVVRDRPSETKPLHVIQKPTMPLATTDTPADFPGHKHYRLLSPFPEKGRGNKAGISFAGGAPPKRLPRLGSPGRA